MQADGLENLRAAVALDGGDAHLGDDLDHAFDRGLDVILAGVLLRQADEQALANHVVERFKGDVRVDGAGPVTDEQGKVMDFARFAGFQNQADARAGAFANEMMMQTGHGQQGGNGSQFLVHAAVGQNEDIGAGLDRAGGAHAKVLHRLDQARLAVAGLEENGQGDGFETGVVDVFEFGEFLIGQNGGIQLDEIATGRFGLEQIALRTDGGGGRRDQFLADAVNGRIGDLGEKLLEIIVEQLRFARQHRQRGVAAHRADGLDAVARHRGHDDAQVLEGVAKSLLALQNAVCGTARGRNRIGRRDSKFNRLPVEPVAVRLFGRNFQLDLLVRHDAPFLGIDQEHASGLEAALLQDPVRRHVQHADLGGHDDQIVLGHVITGGPQAVAIQHGADLFAVGKGDGGRAVPRFHEATVVLVEGLFLVAHRGVIGPRFGDHHHDGVGQGAAGQDEQLEAIVKHGRIAAVGVDDGQQLSSGRRRTDRSGTWPGGRASS